MSTSPLSADGRPLGRRGLETRQRILDAIEQLVAKNGVRNLRLADIAEIVGFSAPAFYQYFGDIDEALLTLNASIGDLTAVVGDTLEEDWTVGDLGAARIGTFVERFLKYWDDHRPVLWARNMAADDGDERFQALRDESLVPVAQALSRKIAFAQAAGRVPMSVAPMAVATSLTMLLERMAMTYPDLRDLGTDRRDLARSVALIIASMTGAAA